MSGTTITSIDITTAEIETIETAKSDTGIGIATAKETETGTEMEIGTVIGIAIGRGRWRGIEAKTETTIAVADITMNTTTTMMNVDIREAADHATTMATRSAADGVIERIDITNHQTKRLARLLQTRRSPQTKIRPARQNRWNEMLG